MIHSKENNIIIDENIRAWINNKKNSLISCDTRDALTSPKVYLFIELCQHIVNTYLKSVAGPLYIHLSK